MIKFILYLILGISILIDWRLALILILFSALWRRFYQVRKIPRTRLLEMKKNVLVSPIHAKVLEIYLKGDSYFIKTRVGLWCHKGFYSMGYGEVDSLESHESGKKAWSATSIKKLVIQKKYTALLIRFIKNNIIFNLNILHSVSPARPSTLIMPGDRVTPGAHLGWLPLGGIVMIELPSTGKIKVKRGDWLKFFNTEIMEF